jgi:hypothetical protein
MHSSLNNQVIDINHGTSSLQSQQTPFATLVARSNLLGSTRVVVAGLIGSKRGVRLLPSSISNPVYEAAVSCYESTRSKWGVTLDVSDGS